MVGKEDGHDTCRSGGAGSSCSVEIELELAVGKWKVYQSEQLADVQLPSFLDAAGTS